MFDRLSAPISGKRRSNVEVLHLMRTQYANRFDPSVLQAICALCPPYPPGSQVKLSDGKTAVVVHVEGDVYRPTVRMMSENGQTLNDDSVSLKAVGASITHVNGLAVEPFVPADQAGMLV
jgi:hypothetical protein